jgi:hypothetical protein
MIYEGQLGLELEMLCNCQNIVFDRILIVFQYLFELGSALAHTLRRKYKCAVVSAFWRRSN